MACLRFLLPNLALKDWSWAVLIPLNTIQIEDVNSLPDILLAGNDYSTEVETGRNDAGIGPVLIQKDVNNFQPLPVTTSGFYVPGDVKKMERITINKKKCFVVGKNKGEIQVIQSGL